MYVCSVRSECVYSENLINSIHVRLNYYKTQLPCTRVNVYQHTNTLRLSATYTRTQSYNYLSSTYLIDAAINSYQ